jgi:hypothetical protein
MGLLFLKKMVCITSNLLLIMISLFANCPSVSWYDIICCNWRLYLRPMSIFILIANAWNFPFVAIMNGTTVVLPGRDLSPAHITDLILNEKVTFGAGVPTIWYKLLIFILHCKGWCLPGV